MLNVSLKDDVAVVDGILSVRGETLGRFELEKEIGRGANGIVFKAVRSALAQPCAVKVWLNLRPDDHRDKVQQGIAEARKIASAHPNWVPIIYDADTVGGIFFTSMEYLPGVSLKQYLQGDRDLLERWWLARVYMSAINDTTSEESAHGDAHVGNVIIFDYQVDKYETGKRLKLIDFGTSIFVRPNQSRARHWAVVDETYRRILAPFNSLPAAFDGLTSAWGPVSKLDESIRPAFYTDVLDGLRAEAGLPV